MSLSENEREELEWHRKRYRRSKAWKTFEMAMWRGIGLMFLFSWVIPYFISNRAIYVVGSIICIPLGILSDYYGPLKTKKRGEEVNG